MHPPLCRSGSVCHCDVLKIQQPGSAVGSPVREEKPLLWRETRRTSNNTKHRAETAVCLGRFSLLLVFFCPFCFADMACGATLKRSMEFEALLSPQSPKRRRCNPLPGTPSTPSPQRCNLRPPVDSPTHSMSPPAIGGEHRLTPEQIFQNLRQEYSRIQRRRQLEGAFNQTEACTSSDAPSPSSSLNAPSSPPGASRKDQPSFTLKQVSYLCERLLKDHEEKIREEYEQILNTKLAEQYESFVKFTQDQIMRRYGARPASCALDHKRSNWTGAVMGDIVLEEREPFPVDQDERRLKNQVDKPDGDEEMGCCDKLQQSVSKWMLPEDHRSTYLERANCFPPPIFIILISIAELAVFIYYAVWKPQKQWVTLDEGIWNSPLTYKPERRQEAWRFISYMFVHAGVQHIVGNLVMQLLVGIPLELVHKGFEVGMVYLAGVLAGSLSSSIFDPLSALVGASGGVYALLGGYFMNAVVSQPTALTDYINFCVENTVPTRTVRSFSNSKPWIPQDIKALLKKKRRAFESGNKEELKSVQRELRRMIRKGKKRYRRKMEHQLQQNNICGVWKGLKTISGFKEPKSQPHFQFTPRLLGDKLQLAGVDLHLTFWILDYLTHRPQFVRVQGFESDRLLCSTGAPQGTVLAPFLFTLYTADFLYNTPSCHLQKFSDDSAVVGLITDGDDREYRGLIQDFADWCLRNNLQINASKTKELVVDFRRRSHSPPAPNFREMIPLLGVFRILAIVLFVGADFGFALYRRFVSDEAGLKVSFVAHFGGIVAGMTVGYVFFSAYNQKLLKDPRFWLCIVGYIVCVLFAVLFNIFLSPAS
ncbi:hypothetical protein L3Q82_013435 [Scortum barcoo]|uniref:Uncharacterized protein n=1 Tax=Scortum barcoo TaxID=214431 RepID=A0ACB8W0N6_9TELE|nr:hypothetical protein L3Q82_013435 [Scortum barcoo]